METQIPQEATPQSVQRRKWWLAMLLSFYIPGLGQIYNGQWIKGSVFTTVLLVLMLSLLEFTWVDTGLELLLVCVAVFLLIAVAAVDALIVATKRKIYVPRPFNHWGVYVGIAAVFMAVYLYYIDGGHRRLLAFSIPTTSNTPGMYQGDFVMADQRAYTNAKPRYGDLIIFTGPDGYIWTFRVVALPGDVVEVRDGRLVINQKLCPYTFIKEGRIQEMEGFSYGVKEYTETLPNGFSHTVYYSDDLRDSTQRNQYLRVLPPDEYYVMGDNRDFSVDSRRIGFIPLSAIRGKILFCYMSRNTSRIGMDL